MWCRKACGSLAPGNYFHYPNDYWQFDAILGIKKLVALLRPASDV